MNSSSWVCSVVSCDEEIQRDIGILMRNGFIQEQAAHHYTDSPSGWFRYAAVAYLPVDSMGKLAKQACLITANRFMHGRPE